MQGGRLDNGLKGVCLEKGAPRRQYALRLEGEVGQLRGGWVQGGLNESRNTFPGGLVASCCARCTQQGILGLYISTNGTPRAHRCSRRIVGDVGKEVVLCGQEPWKHAKVR